MTLARIILILFALNIDAARGFRISDLHKETENRINGGQDAAYGQFPHQVSLYLYYGLTPEGPFSFCGGIIISENWVLSAAHCVRPTRTETYNYVITAGHINRTVEEPTEQMRKSTIGYVHEFYFGSTLSAITGYDVGLIYVSEPFVFNFYVDKICYAPASYDIHGSGAPSTGYISGWGVPYKNGTVDDLYETLQWAEVPIQTDSTCEAAIPLFYSTKQNVCVGHEGLTACNGDSGGPLTIEDQRIVDVSNPQLNNKMVAGITSKSSSAVSCDPYTIYVKISYFANWIEKKTQILPCQIEN